MQELRAEYEYKQMETEADCVARIVAVEMCRSCTNKVGTTAGSTTKAIHLDPCCGKFSRLQPVYLVRRPVACQVCGGLLL